MEEAKFIILAACFALAIAAALGCSHDGEIFTDQRDGKSYKTVKIGEQIWMAENLNYDAEGSACNDDNPANCDAYGRLYKWEAAISACPGGWHLPAKSEWEAMVEYIGGSSVEGKKLKAKNGWNKADGKSGNGTDSYGFAALPGGNCNSNGDFSSTGINGYWWSNSEDGNDAHGRHIYNVDFAHWHYINKLFLLSVRCLQD